MCAWKSTTKCNTPRHTGVLPLPSRALASTPWEDRTPHCGNHIHTPSTRTPDDQLHRRQHPNVVRTRVNASGQNAIYCMYNTCAETEYRRSQYLRDTKPAGISRALEGNQWKTSCLPLLRPMSLQAYTDSRSILVCDHRATLQVLFKIVDSHAHCCAHA